MDDISSVPTSDVLLTDEELAAMLKISLSMVQKWRVLGKGPAFIKIPGGSVRYRRSEVEAWLDASTRLVTDGSRFMLNRGLGPIA